MNKTLNRSLVILTMVGGVSLLGLVHTTEPTPAKAEPVVVSAGDGTATPEVIMEDDPRWDCRTMGNHLCGAEIKGAWYLIQFDNDGNPIGVQ